MLELINDELLTPIDEILPPVGERVIVQCEGFRCVGVCDPNGSWRSSFDNQELTGVRGFKRFAKRN